LKKDGTFKSISASDIRVGDIIKLNQNERVPADMILLFTTEK
jgi:magnesium-transporting ATPase (P-type)